MEQMLLVRCAPAYAAQIASYRQECLDTGSRMDGCGLLRRMEDPMDWVRWCQSWDTDGALPTDMDWVRTTQFLCIRASDGKMVGTIQVRHTLNQMLAAYGGHIGYSVRPSERRKGYAAWMLGEVLPFCRQLGLARVLITCTPDNEASRRTILANGGVYESTVFEADRNRELERYWIDLTPQTKKGEQPAEKSQKSD